jgi:hypothetical protein
MRMPKGVRAFGAPGCLCAVNSTLGHVMDTTSSSTSSEEDWYTRQRKALPGLARIRGLPDGVFSIVAHNHVGSTGWPHAPGPNAIAIVRRHPNYAGLKGRFVAENPGFSQDSYDYAMHLGASGAR